MHIKCNQYYLWYFYHLYFCSKCKGSAALFNYKYGVTCAWQTYHSHNPLSYTSATFNCPDFFHHLELKESNSCTLVLSVYGSIQHHDSDDIFFFNRSLYSNFSGAVNSARWSCHITVVKEWCLSLLCFLGGLYVLLIPLRICLELADHNL